MLSSLGVKDYVQYNEKVKKLTRNVERMVPTVVIADELGEVWYYLKRDVAEKCKNKLSACGRNASRVGINFIIASQRHDAKQKGQKKNAEGVVPVGLKSNAHARVCLSVFSKYDLLEVLASKLYGIREMPSGRRMLVRSYENKHPIFIERLWIDESIIVNQEMFV